MGISNFTLERIYNEIKDKLINAKIERIISISDNSYLLSLFKDNKSSNLLLSLDPSLPLILLSRRHYGFLKRLLEIEIPEINDGTVILYSVAREAGIRSKIAVYSEVDNVEAVGAVIGANGSRINRVLKQVGNEKIDIVLYDKDPVTFIKNAMSPAKDLEVFITNPKKKEAICVVNRDNLSLAIGKKGINVKLAARLTRYKIDVKCLDDVNILEYREKYNNILKEEEVSEADEENTNA